MSRTLHCSGNLEMARISVRPAKFSIPSFPFQKVCAHSWLLLRLSIPCWGLFARIMAAMAWWWGTSSQHRRLTECNLCSLCLGCCGLFVYQGFFKGEIWLIALNIWSRYLDFIEKHAHVLATGLGTETPQFLDMCYKKAIAATQYHIPEVYLLQFLACTHLIFRGSEYGLVS